MAQITVYQNYTIAGMSIVKRYDFIDDIWQMIKEYMGVDHGIPLSFIPRFLKLTKTNMCGVSNILICYNPQNAVNLKTYKKNRLIKNILTIFCNEFSKKPLHIRTGLMAIAINYINRI